jgi:mRNA-degrading endonuclease RelE of RelBE toxin-antitoxin system
MAVEWIQFIEWSGFADRRDELLGREGYDALQRRLISNPRTGKVIRRAGGCRKLRARAPGRGKRSGSRVIYYFHDEAGRIHLLALYAKNEQADLTPTQARQLGGIVAKIKERGE